MKVRTKRKICAAVSGFGFLMMLGGAGGIETNTITLAGGVAYMAIGLAIFAAAAYKGGYMN